MTTPETHQDVHALRQEVAQLQHKLEMELAATRSAFVVLARYLAEGGQLYLNELCDDLDRLCVVQADEMWQCSVMSLTELLRGVEQRLPKDVE
ncbi:hypothetical protein D3C76_578170 [compost metagenome]